MRRLVPILLSLAAAVSPAAPSPVRYRIAAILDDKAGIVTGTANVCYHNLTPDTLGAVWLHVYPEAFRHRGTEFARELEAMGHFDFALASDCDRGWLAVDTVVSEDRVVLVSRAGTELGLFLAQPLAPGESLAFDVGFRTKVPVRLTELSRSGSSFVLAHWFPQVAARTPTTGWLTGGYHVFGHSPAAFADYDVTIDVPDRLHVAATGSAADDRVPNDQPGRQAARFAATNVSDFAIVAAPGLKTMTDSIAGVRVTVLAKGFLNPDWFEALASIVAMLRSMQEWNGPFPFPELTVVDGSGVVAQDASYPGLIVMATRPIPGTRLFEQALARQVALQWTACETGADELSDPGVAQGPATYSELRYLDTRYGSTSLVNNPLLRWLFRGLSSEYFHKLYYYLGASNKTLCDDPVECRDQIGYSASKQSRPALLLLAEERKLGVPTFDDLMRNWVETQSGAHPSRTEFAAHFPSVHSQIIGTAPADTILPTRLEARRATFLPVFALPNFTDYQIFYGPYAWIDNYHGLQLSAWMQGRQFVDAGPLHGRHNWTASEVYSTKIDDWHSSVSYTTPLSFINDRLRMYTALDYSLIDAGAKLYFTQELGPAFRQPKTTIDFGYRILDLYNLRFRNRTAWDSARTADIHLRVSQTYETRLLKGGQGLYAARGQKTFGSQYDYWQMSIEEVHTLRALPKFPVTLRLFGGAVFGEVPAQKQFYLSGGLQSSNAEPVSWGYEGWTSGQERWHYDADVNCRAWAGEYLHGRYAYGMNLYLQPIKYVQPFLDVGNVSDTLRAASFWRPRLDAGIRLKLGPLYADFPFWRYRVGEGKHEFAFRWMLGLKVGDLLSGS